MAIESVSSRSDRRRVSHLDDFYIGAFRGVKEVRLEKLGKINILVGNNNAGKTSVLESISVFLNPSDLSEWSSIARNREVRANFIVVDQSNIVDGIRWLFPSSRVDVWGRGETKSILLAGRTEHSSIEMVATCSDMQGIIPIELLKRAHPYSRLTDIDGPIEDTGWHIEVNTDIIGPYGESAIEKFEFDLWSQLGLRSIKSRSRKREVVQYLAPYSHRNSSQNLRRLTGASIENKRFEIDQLLRDLDKRIFGVEIVTSEDGRFPKIAVRYQSGELFPLAILGDGLRRALAIALALQSAKDGILLIDEIEAALHVNALDRVYRWLRDACQHYNVQVFATTHSIEAINAISKITSDTNSSELSAYSIGSEFENHVKRYTGGMLYRLVHERGLDIR